MSQELAALWTGKGLDKLAAQLAGGEPVTIKTIAIGDGGGSMPSVQPSVTGLYGEKWRGNVNTVEVDPDSANSVIVEAVIPYNVGGWFIREWGLFDDGGELIAYGPHAEFYKPVLEDGTGAELLERIKLPISNQSQINLTVSSDVLATRKYVDSEVDKLEAALETHASNADTHANLARKTTRIIAGTGLSGGGDLTANRTLSVTYGNAAGTSCQGNDARLSDARTPKAHASAATTYGAGDAANYGHVKLSDTAGTSGVTNGTAATPKAVADEMKKYLPLTGGTMTGTLVTPAVHIKKTDGTKVGDIFYNDEAKYIRIESDSLTVEKTNDGGVLDLYTGDAAAGLAGAFRLGARENLQANQKYLLGKTDGTLTWNGKNIVRTIDNVQADAAGNINTVAEAFRQAMIGMPMLMLCTTLPKGFMWADGSLALFATYPELKAKYDKGGFNGMLLEYNAPAETVSAYPGKFKRNAATPTGLYLPRLKGMFARYCIGSDATAGKYNAPGLPNITGGFWDLLTKRDSQSTMGLARGAFYANFLSDSNNVHYADPHILAETGDGIGFDASKSSAIYGASSTVMPPSIDTPVAIYLGKTTA